MAIHHLQSSSLWRDEALGKELPFLLGSSSSWGFLPPGEALTPPHSPQDIPQTSQRSRGNATDAWSTGSTKLCSALAAHSGGGMLLEEMRAQAVPPAPSKYGAECAAALQARAEGMIGKKQRTIPNNPEV